jgi:membrane-associated protease RseP (regulator of RpoE activity)
MTIRKLLLTLSIVLSCGLVVSGIIVSAQEAPKAPEAPKSQKAPKAPKDEVAENDFDFDFKLDDKFDFDFDDKFDWQDGDRNFTLLLQGGTFLGVHVEDVTKENMSRYGMREVRGVGVTEIVKDSPAEKAGLRKDDVILGFNGESVTSTRKLNRLVSESAPDQNVRLAISRGGSEQEVSATLSKRPGPGMLNAKIREDFKQKMEQFRKDMPKFKTGDGTWVFSTGSYRRIGIGTQTLTKQLADYFGVTEGILITSVNDNSPAAKAGLKAGDVITAVDGEKVSSPGDISRAIGKKQEGSVTLTVVRDRNPRSVVVTPEKPPAGSGDIRTIVTPDLRTIVTPQINIPVIPAITIQTPQITVPAIPPVQVTVPARVRTRVII